MVVTEYQQRVFYAPRPCQTHYGVPKVHNARVDLNNNDNQSLT